VVRDALYALARSKSFASTLRQTVSLRAGEEGYVRKQSLQCTLPLAALVALVFRFPIPFSGYSSGPKAMVAAMFAAFFYGLLGGVLVQAVAGCLGGLAAYSLARDNMLRNVLSVLLGMVAAMPGLLILAMLDWIIGPW
jgi:hypothetical protein